MVTEECMPSRSVMFGICYGGAGLVAMGMFALALSIGKNPPLSTVVSQLANIF